MDFASEDFRVLLGGRAARNGSMHRLFELDILYIFNTYNASFEAHAPNINFVRLPTLGELGSPTAKSTYRGTTWHGVSKPL